MHMSFCEFFMFVKVKFVLLLNINMYRVRLNVTYVHLIANLITIIYNLIANMYKIFTDIRFLFALCIFMYNFYGWGGRLYVHGEV